MPSLKELKTICRKPRAKYHNWWAVAFSRHFSIYFTWFFVRTPITPNQLTFFQIFLAWLATLLLIIWQWQGAIAWIILMQLCFIFDLVDGEVARYKKLSSLFGIVLDSFGHILINPAIYWSLALFVYQQTSDTKIIYLVIFLSIFLISPSKHALMRGLIFLITKKDNPIYNYENLNKGVGENKEREMNVGFIKNTIQFFKVVSEFPNDMTIFCVLMIVSLVLKNTIILSGGIWFFSLLIIFKEFYFIYQIKKKRLVEKEYQKIYQK